MQIRQGDVLLVQVREPKHSIKTESLGLRVPGERTGHAHILPADVHTTPDGRTLLKLDEPSEMTHDEHGTISVGAGWWEPRLQREFSPASRPTRRAMFD